MLSPVIEGRYPITFREQTAQELGEQLAHRRSVHLVGMKRVGISNFLRFFLYHPDIVSTYISKEQQHVFIAVDLNDLVERELFPFWTLTLKRIVDAASQAKLSPKTKARIESLFLTSIQSQDLFLLIDNVRQALMEMSNEQLLPTLFFLRFDRIKDTINPSFFDNLVGLRDATHQRLCYVFTSFRSLDVLSPGVFPKASLSVFSHLMYIPPASTADMQVIYAALNKRYQLRLSSVLETALFTMVAGNVQYLQLALIILNEKKKELPISKEALLELLISDERFALQSEELWESLTDEEQKVLMKVQSHEILNEQDREQGQYLWQVGFLQDEAEKTQLFSPLFAQYIHAKSQDFKNGQEEKNIHFSRKEHLLFTLLEKFLGEICERDEIISAVWPEYQELGVSDWAIDRLVARVRTKLREQESKYEIKTIRTRGYQLIISH